MQVWEYCEATYRGVFLLTPDGVRELSVPPALSRIPPRIRFADDDVLEEETEEETWNLRSEIAKLGADGWELVGFKDEAWVLKRATSFADNKVRQATWEYFTVLTRMVNIGAQVKHQNSRDLDPDISDWLSHSTKVGIDDLGRVAWSTERKHWTPLGKLMKELGEQGWELIGTSELYEVNELFIVGPQPYPLQYYFKRRLVD